MSDGCVASKSPLVYRHYIIPALTIDQIYLAHTEHHLRHHRGTYVVRLYTRRYKYYY